MGSISESAATTLPVLTNPQLAGSFVIVLISYAWYWMKCRTYGIPQDPAKVMLLVLTASSLAVVLWSLAISVLALIGVRVELPLDNQDVQSLLIAGLIGSLPAIVLLVQQLQKLAPGADHAGDGASEHAPASDSQGG